MIKSLVLSSDNPQFKKTLDVFSSYLSVFQHKTLPTKKVFKSPSFQSKTTSQVDNLVDNQSLSSSVDLETNSTEVSVVVLSSEPLSNEFHFKDFSTDQDLVFLIGSFELGNWVLSNSIIINHMDIPSGTTFIPDMCYYMCSTISSFSLPASVELIGKSAFGYCSDITSLYLPDSITTIDNKAFEYCKNLQEINIPKSLSSLGDLVFIGCQSLKSIKIPKEITSEKLLKKIKAELLEI